jgi:hypothetical protein
MPRDLDELAREKLAYVVSDGTGFRRAARTLQSLWRESKGLPNGEHNGVPLGSRLPVDFSERELANYLTDGIKGVVRSEVARSELEPASVSPLFSKPRIYNDLLSSQPLCFNLFGELKLDLGLARKALCILRPGSIQSVRSIDFEYSPGRSNERFTGDRSAFDVFVDYEAAGGGRGFLGIEVKYHENLKDQAASLRSRYDDVACAMKCFKKTALPQLRKAPLQQLWRDHLLLGSMLDDKSLGYTEGAFILVYPAANAYCRSAMQAYRRCLDNAATFDAWTLEEIISVLSLVTPSAWVGEFRSRYLDFSKLACAL